MAHISWAARHLILCVFVKTAPLAVLAESRPTRLQAPSARRLQAFSDPVRMSSGFPFEERRNSISINHKVRSVSASTRVLLPIVTHSLRLSSPLIFIFMRSGCFAPVLMRQKRSFSYAAGRSSIC